MRKALPNRKRSEIKWAPRKTVTLEEIRACGPCQEGWLKLVKFLRKRNKGAWPLTKRFDPALVIESNGVHDAVWLIDTLPSLGWANPEWVRLDNEFWDRIHRRTARLERRYPRRHPERRKRMVANAERVCKERIAHYSDEAREAELRAIFKAGPPKKGAK